MTKKEEVRVVEKGACRGSICIRIGHYRYFLSFFLIDVVGQVSN
jgi:hypothetical protein